MPASKQHAKQEKKRRKRTIISPEQLQKLEQSFKSSPWPTRSSKDALAADIGVGVKFICVWFQNRRAKNRRVDDERNASTSKMKQSSSRAKGSKDVKTAKRPKYTDNPGPSDGPDSEQKLEADNTRGCIETNRDGSSTDGTFLLEDESDTSMDTQSTITCSSTPSTLKRQAKKRPLQKEGLENDRGDRDFPAMKRIHVRKFKDTAATASKKNQRKRAPKNTTQTQKSSNNAGDCGEKCDSSPEANELQRRSELQRQAGTSVVYGTRPNDQSISMYRRILPLDKVKMANGTDTDGNSLEELINLTNKINNQMNWGTFGLTSIQSISEDRRPDLLTSNTKFGSSKPAAGKKVMLISPPDQSTCLEPHLTLPVDDQSKEDSKTMMPAMQLPSNITPPSLPLFKAMINMMAIVEGGIIPLSHPDFDMSVNDVLYGIRISGCRLVYTKENGFDVIDDVHVSS